MAHKLIRSECVPISDEHKVDSVIVRREYIVDTDADFANLPKSDPSSTAVSPSGKVKIVNASGEWVDFGEG